jgi:hypothetical protein
MNSERKIKILKTAFWIGAIIDGKAFFLFLFPGLLPNVTKFIFDMSIPEATCQEAVWLRILAAIFDLGWTMLLIWAALKPIERKGIMLLTVFPILSGILVLRIMNTFNTVVSTAYIITNVIFVFLLIFFAYSYLINCNWFEKK